MSDRIKHFRSQPGHDTRRGFTLIELLVVMTIIVLMVATAVPAIRFIVGSRSTESATNVVSAFLGRARSGAIQSHRTEGVFFFLDPDTDLTTLAVVAGGGKDELAEYEAWTEGQLEYRFTQFGAPVQYYQSGTTQGPSRVVKLVDRTAVTGENGPFRLKGQLFLQPYSCRASHPSANATAPPSATYWGKSSERFIDLADNTDFQTLPSGVGLQLINDTKKLTGTAGIGGYADRYLRTGCILFDSNGQFQSLPWGVASTSVLGGKLRLPLNANNSRNTSDRHALDVVNAAQDPLLFSGFGVVLYDRQVLKNIRSFTGSNGAVSFGTGSSENDSIFAGMLPGLVDPAAGDETREEDWLDNNTLPLMINRLNGTLIKGE